MEGPDRGCGDPHGTTEGQPHCGAQHAAGIAPSTPVAKQLKPSALALDSKYFALNGKETADVSLIVDKMEGQDRGCGGPTEQQRVSPVVELSMLLVLSLHHCCCFAACC